MNFNSIIFILFFILVYSFYLTSVSWRRKKILLLGASYFFYGWWNPYYISLLLLSTVIDFYCGRAMCRSSNSSSRIPYLYISLITNLGILVIFKYFNFFADSVFKLFDIIGFKADPFTINVLLPVGISFYTFQSMSYTIDIYRKRLKPASSFLDFGLYVSFFPQLVAGPIMRATDFLPQLINPPKVTVKKIEIGLKWIVYGYFLKMGVADNLASSVDTVYAQGASPLPIESLLGTYYFSFQIFADFFGYTLIARGLGKLMGFELSENFRAPYISRSLQEFWGRWHISLSSWLRDYLYISLGGNRKGKARTYRNLMLTMLLGGLWHGASPTFIVWGAIHGIYLVVEKNLSKFKFTNWLNRRSLFVDLIRIIAVFHLVTLAWIFFRADSLSHALEILLSISDLNNLLTFHMPNKYLLKDGIWILPVVIYYINIYIRENYKSEKEIFSGIRLSPSFRMIGLAVILFVTIICRETSNAFLYFQF